MLGYSVTAKPARREKDVKQGPGPGVQKIEKARPVRIILGGKLTPKGTVGVRTGGVGGVKRKGGLISRCGEKDDRQDGQLGFGQNGRARGSVKIKG